ncbi:MAG: glycosyltransferase, partial [Candidatus Micrarchaeota archaeon]
MRIAWLLDGEFPSDPRVEKQAESLVKAGHEVTVFCKTKEGKPSGETRGVRVERLKLP